MSIFINKVQILGNVGGEPKVMTLQDGTMIAQLNVATSTGGYKKKDGTELPLKTTWHRVVAWRNIAKVISERVHKGNRILIEGALENRKWTDKDGAEHETTDIVANDMYLFDKPQTQPMQQPVSNQQQTATAPVQGGTSDDYSFPF